MEGGGGEVAAASEPAAAPCPWLVYYHGKGYRKWYFSSETAGPSPVKTTYTIPPALRHKKVLSCAHGCLVLYDYRAQSLSLCNATTLGDTRVLPHLSRLSSNHNKLDSCVLLPPPPGGRRRTNDHNNNNWHGFTVSIFMEKLSSIVFCRVGGETEWREISYEKYLEEPNSTLVRERFQTLAREQGRPPYFRRAVGFRGKIYAQLGAEWIAGFCYSLMSIEIVEEEEEDGEIGGLVLRTVDEPAGLSISCVLPYINVYMVASSGGGGGGELFLLHFSPGAQPVFEVYQMKNLDTTTSTSTEWERMKSIKDDTGATLLFFIGKNYCLSCPSGGSRGGRHIYFTRRKDRRQYCYDVEDGSVLMSSPHLNLPTPPWLPPPIWMNPQHVLPSIKQEDKQNNQRRRRRRSIVVTSKLLEPSKNTNVCIQLCDLPFDLLEHFSKHLTTMDYMNFRATSKMCRSLCPPINWRVALSGTDGSSGCFPSPLLMFPDRHESVFKFVDPSTINTTNGNNCYFMSMPESLRNHIIRYSDQGWVLLSKSRSCVDLYNPFKKEIITYNYTRTLREDGFFFIGNAPGSMIPIRVVFCDGAIVIVSISDPDDPDDEEWSWDEMKGNKEFHAATTQTGPVWYKDAFYFLDKRGKLGSLDFESGEMRWEVVEKPQRPADLIKFYDHNFLVGCGGGLISVYLGRAGKWVSVYRLSDDLQVWEKVSSLGGYDLYLNPIASSSSSSPRGGGGGGNRIYFPVLRGGSDVVYFSMETGRWHFSGSPQEDSSTNLYGTRWYPNSCWIKPCW